MKTDLSGIYTVTTNEVSNIPASLPGTLDTNRIGHADTVNKPWHPDLQEKGVPAPQAEDGSAKIISRLTRNYTYEGPARFSRVFEEEGLRPEDASGRMGKEGRSHRRDLPDGLPAGSGGRPEVPRSLRHFSP